MNRKIILTLLLLLCMAQTTMAQSAQKGVVVANNSVDWEHDGVIVENIPTFAIKTNLLLDALSIINVEVEVPMYSHWSICAKWIFPWWYNPSRQRCIEILAGELQGRYWFENHIALQNLTGWFVGGYVTGGYYDLERDWRGVQGELWGGGVCGGYSHRLWCNLRIEYSLGVGIIHTSYDKYNALWDCQNQLRLLRHSYGSYNWWGVNKMEVSVAWMFNRINKEWR